MYFEIERPGDSRRSPTSNRSLAHLQSMLNRQYGMAAPPSIIPVAHPEDSQPNEKIHGRSRNMPPRVNTVRAPRFDRNLSNTGQPFSQYATRGSGPWRGHRPGHRASSSRQEMQSHTYNPRVSREDHGSHHLRSSTPASFRTCNVSEGPSGDIEGHSRSAMSSSVASQPLPPAWTEYRSPSPKLPPDPLRRRIPVIPVQPLKPSRLPPPGRKRRADESSPEILPAKKLRVTEATPQVAPAIIVDDSHEPISTTPVHIEQTPPPRHLPTSFSPHRSSPVIVIKDEPSSPEPITPSRKLVTAACKFWPTPYNCRKSAPNYAANRLAFAKEQCSALSKLGLKKTKVFFREDGMVIDWKSAIPVWDDTLLPESPRPTTPSVGIRQQVARSPSPNRARDSLQVIDVDALPSPAMSPKRKRKAAEVIDVDAFTTPAITPKKPRINLSEVSSAKGGEQAGSATPSTRRAKVKHTEHWAKGLSKADRMNLGKCDQSKKRSPHSKPTLDSALTPSRSGVGQNASMRPMVESPTKRLALPTRLHRQRAATQEITSILTLTEKTSDQLPSTQPRSEQSAEHSILLSTPSNHDRRLRTSPEQMNEGDVLSPTNPKKSVLGVGSNVVGNDVYSLVDRLLSENHVPGCTEHEQKGSAEPIIRGQNGREGSIQSDFPEYEMAKEFVRRFVLYFDSDRAQLEMAYSKDALFSCRNHRSRESMTSVDDSSSTGADTSNPISKSICQGRAHVIHALSSLENHSFSPRGVPSKTVYYDLAALPRKVVSSYEGPGDDDDVGIVLATVHSDFVKMDPEDENLDHTWILNQSFVLRRRLERDDDDDVNGGASDLGLRPLAKDLWPVVAISHQMMLMDKSLLPSDEIPPLLPEK